VTPLQIILFLAILMAVVSLAAVLAWLVYGAYLTARERRLAARKGLYRDLVTGLATRERRAIARAMGALTPPAAVASGGTPSTWLFAVPR